MTTRWLGLALIVVACSHPGNAPADSGATSDAPVSVDAPNSSHLDAAPPDAPSARFLCGDPVPGNAPIPTPPPLKTGCPMLGSGENSFTSGGVTRTFQLVLPTTRVEAEVYPVIVMWHWLKSTSDDVINTADVQAAVDDQRFIAVVPDNIPTDIALTTYDVNWPFDITQTDARMQQEFSFFDDMLSCVEQQYTVNQQCVSTFGVSAGGLFVDQLIQARSTTLSSFLSLSGGVGATIIKPWVGVTRKLPGLVLWGGKGPPTMPTKDILGCFGLGMDFDVASTDLEDGMTADGQFLVECVHDCGHAVPPVDAPPGESQFAGLWEFMFNHPYWLPPGTSPYQQTGLKDLPAWCAIGENNAVPRVGGTCPSPINPCPF
jgi:Putative esterase